MNLRETFDALYPKLKNPRERFCPYRLCPLGAHSDHQFGCVTGFAIDHGVTVRYGARPKIDAERLVDLARSDAGVRLSPAGIVKLRVADPRADRIAAAALALRKLAGPEA